MPITSYSTGTVSVEAGGTVVTLSGGVLTSANARSGDDLVIAGAAPVIINDVTDTLHFEIDPYPGVTVVDADYKIVHRSPLRFAGGQAMADVSKLIAVLNDDDYFVLVPAGADEPDPSYGEEGQSALQRSTGKTWVKTGGDWVYLGVYKGFGTPAPYNNATTYSLQDVATDNGSAYVWINPTAGAGHSPPNATYWALLAGRGATGAAGPAGAAGANGTNGLGYGGTSTDSRLIGIPGPKTFTIGTGYVYQVGMRVRATSAANTANWMEGIVASYSGGVLSVTTDKVGGSGTFSDWVINGAGQPGAGDMLAANNLSDLANSGSARSNLGLGNSATRAVGTTSGTVAAGDDSRFAGIVRTVKRQVFTASGTYTPSAGMLYADVECLGGGGAGGGAAATSGSQVAMGSGGGGGGYAKKTISAATIGASQSVTVGAGGTGVAGNNSGNAGSSSSFGSLVQATGGGGGTGSAVSTGGNTISGASGGVGSLGDVNAAGGSGNGSLTVSGPAGVSGNGGNSVYGGGGIGANSGGGYTGQGYGAGGSGAANYVSSAATAGGAGRPGLVIVTEYCSQ